MTLLHRKWNCEWINGVDKEYLYSYRDSEKFDKLCSDSESYKLLALKIRILFKIQLCFHCYIDYIE